MCYSMKLLKFPSHVEPLLSASQVSGLKSITAKHLALSSQCISLVFALIAGQ